MGEYLGEVQPIYGRWHWPLKAMKEGDWFHVDHTLRSPEEVRHYVGVRAAQLGMRFSVASIDPERPGYCKVTRPSHDEADYAKPKFALLDYEKAGNKFAELYGFDIQQVPAGELWNTGRGSVAVKQKREAKVDRLVFPFPPHDKVGARLFSDHISFEVIPAGMSVEDWAEELSLDDVMS
jgi:hypothetical protein